KRRSARTRPPGCWSVEASSDAAPQRDGATGAPPTRTTESPDPARGVQRMAGETSAAPSYLQSPWNGRRIPLSPCVEARIGSQSPAVLRPHPGSGRRQEVPDRVRWWRPRRRSARRSGRGTRRRAAARAPDAPLDSGQEREEQLDHAAGVRVGLGHAAAAAGGEPERREGDALTGQELRLRGPVDRDGAEPRSTAGERGREDHLLRARVDRELVSDLARSRRERAEERHQSAPAEQRNAHERVAARGPRGEHDAPRIRADAE